MVSSQWSEAEVRRLRLQASIDQDELDAMRPKPDVSPQLNHIILYIPVLPDLDLTANSRRNRHYMQQAKDTVTERIKAGLLLENATRGWQSANGGRSLADWWVGLKPPVALHWVLYWPPKTRARDVDGCADLLKPWQDALVDLGWLKNDSPRFVRTVSYTCVPSSPQGPSMTLQITAMGGS